MTVLVSTHYMDEAERCHQIAYISFGRLLVSGTADEVIHAAQLHTWRATGGDLARLVALAESEGDWMAAAFGTAVHVTSATRDDFPQWLAQRAPGHRWDVTPIAPGLEDLFISLMSDNGNGARPAERIDG
jgi:ABC-2 type transport system ATP-binding protein